MSVDHLSSTIATEGRRVSDTATMSDSLPRNESSADTVIATPYDGKSPAATVCDVGAICDKLKSLDDTASREGDLEKANSQASSVSDVPAVPAISNGRKWVLLIVFSLAMFIDIWMYSAFFIFTDVIATDLDISFAQQSWVITSYSVTFAAFLLFWGRVSDLYSAKPVFSYGFAVLGVLSLVISFLPDQYSFFVLRAIAGIAGSALIPSSYRLIIEVFDEHERGRAFTLFGMSGAIANVTGVLIAGVIDLIPMHGQGSSWRWFFRLLTVMIAPLAAMAFLLTPNRRGADATQPVKHPKWKRLDLPGSLLMLSAIILLVLALTFGAAYGFRTASFLVPFLLSLVVLTPAFFVWEAKVPEDLALLPPRFWKVPNVALLIAFALPIYPWWGVNFLAHVEVYTKVYGESGIHSAVRVLPQGVGAFAVVLLLTLAPKLVSRPRWTVIVGGLASIVGYVLFVQNTRYVGADYWKWVFSGSVIGSPGMAAVFTATNVALMTSVDPEMAGVAGAMLQVAFQIGSSVGFGVQAGLFTVNPGGLANPANVQASFYFQLGWTILWLLMFVVFYRQPKSTGAVVVAAH